MGNLFEKFLGEHLEYNLEVMKKEFGSFPRTSVSMLLVQLGRKVPESKLHLQMCLYT